METCRQLGATERLFYKMREYGGINSLAFAHGKIHSEHSSTGIINQERMINALSLVQSESFLLRSVINDNNGTPEFRLAEHTTLPITFIDQCTNDKFDDLLEQAMTVRYENSPYLWSVTLVHYANDPAKFSIIAAFDHTIADGTSMCYFLDSVMKKYQSLDTKNGMDIETHQGAQNFEPDLESFTQYKLAFKDIINFAPNEISKMFRPPMQPTFLSQTDFTQRKTKVCYFKFSEQLTNKLLHAAREKQTTLHGIIVAAFLLCVAKRKWQEMGIYDPEKSTNPPTLKLSATNNVSFRKEYDIPNHQTGVYISAVNHQFKISKNTEFWPLAKSVTNAIASAKNKNLHISSTLIFEWLQRLMSDSFRMNLLNSKVQGRLETLCVSNMGKLNISGTYDNIDLTDIGVCSGQHGFGPSYMMLPLSFKNQLSYVFHFIEPLLSKEHAEEICQDINALLHQCLDLPETTPQTHSTL